MGQVGSLGGKFKIANAKPPRRLVVAVDGLEKGGKTHFALTMPGPMAYQNFDIGLEGVIEPFQSEKEIHRADYGIDISKGDSQEIIMSKAGPEFDGFVNDYKKLVIPGMLAKKVRSGVWDTGSEIWEVQRLARFGKLTQVMPHHYTALNIEYQNLVKDVFDTPGNFCILHKLKAEWKDNPTTGKGNKTGGYERAGYAGTGFLVQVNVLAWRAMREGDKPGFPTGDFHITVKDCRQNPGVAGLDLDGEMATFPWLGVNVYPDSTLEDWM